MTTTVYAVADFTKKVRQSDGEGQTIYDRVDDVRRHHVIPGPQQNTEGRQTLGQSSKTVRRVLIVALCLGMLCVILLGVIIGLSVHYNSANNNLMLERNHLKSEVNQLREAAVKPCPSGWQRFGSSCYNRSSEERTWEESRTHCLQKGADLVIINSKEKQEFIRELTSGKGASWIGLKNTEGKWTWVDGTPLTTIGYWTSGRPYNDTDLNCVLNHRHKQGDWMDTDCEEVIHSICEK